MLRLCTLCLLLWLAGDAAFSLVLTVRDSLLPAAANKALSPQLAFGGLQAAVGAAVLLVLLPAAAALWHCQHANQQHRLLPVLSWPTLGLLTLLVFCAPSLPLWWATGGAWLDGRDTVSWDSPRYLISAAAQVPLFFLCLHALWRQWRLRRPHRVAAPATVYLPPDFRQH